MSARNLMLVENHKPQQPASLGRVLKALLACVVLLLLSPGSATADEARPGRQIFTGKSVADQAPESGALFAEDSDEEDCHNRVAANECCTGYCPLAIMSNPVAPAPPSAEKALLGMALAYPCQAGAISLERPPRTWVLARMQGAERA